MFYPKTLIGVSLILLIIQSASCIWQPNNSKMEKLCNSNECKARGTLYRNNMDDSAHPCQDFYSFTCGNWHKQHPGPKYSADRSVIDVMVSDFHKIIRDILESYNSKAGGNILFQKAKEVYDICVKIPEYPKAVEPNAIAQEIKKIGRLPKTRLWDIHNKYLKLTGESALFRTAVIGDAVQGNPVLIVMEPVSAYGSIKHDMTWKPQEKQAYTRFLFEAIKSLNLPGTDAQINERIQKVFNFRRKFDRIIQDNLGAEPQSLYPFTAQELDKWFSDWIPYQTITQDIPWVEVMGALYHKMPIPVRHPRKLIAMRQHQYFVDLMELLEDESEEVLAYHMEIYFIERHMKLTNKMYQLLEATSVEPHSLLRYIRERFYSRWETCIENHNMKETLEEMIYINKKYNPRERQGMIRRLFINIKRKIYTLMSEAKWLDVKTLANTLEKLNDIEPWIAFPPWMSGIGRPTPRDPGEILKPNALLNMNEKWLYITPPLLISPIFSTTIPAVYNYAGLGTTIGHELYHVIDDCGSYLGMEGDIIWWDDKVRKPCLEKLKSFVKAYNEVTDREFKNRYNVVIKSNTSNNVLENYPDVMGFEASLSLYKDHVSEDKSLCETLPHFEKYSCEQMFYIAFANGYCAYYNKKSAMEKLELWEHSIESVRVNGVVSQMESFGTTFGCPVGTPMNPKKKANLWK